MHNNELGRIKAIIIGETKGAKPERLEFCAHAAAVRIIREAAALQAPATPAPAERERLIDRLRWIADDDFPTEMEWPFVQDTLRQAVKMLRPEQHAEPRGWEVEVRDHRGHSWALFHTEEEAHEFASALVQGVESLMAHADRCMGRAGVTYSFLRDVRDALRAAPPSDTEARLRAMEETNG